MSDKMTAEERAELVCRPLLVIMPQDEHWRDFVVDVANQIKSAEEAAREEGKRDSIIEFCEGDRSLLAEYEQKAEVQGFQRGQREMLNRLCFKFGISEKDKKHLIDSEIIEGEPKA